MDRKRGHGRESGKSATLHRMTSERHCTVVKGAMTSDAYFIFALGSVALLRFRYRYHVSDHDHLCYHNGVRVAGPGPSPSPGPSISCHRAGTGFHVAGTRYVRVPLCPICANPPPVSILLERIPDWTIKHSCILTHVATGTTRDRNTIAQGTSRVGLLTRPDGCIAESHCSKHSLTYSLACTQHILLMIRRVTHADHVTARERRQK